MTLPLGRILRVPLRSSCPQVFDGPLDLTKSGRVGNTLSPVKVSYSFLFLGGGVGNMKTVVSSVVIDGSIILLL